MDDLKPWDFKREFTIEEAASLMLGLRPDMTTSVGGSLDPVVQRMTEDHKRARSAVSMRVYQVEQGRAPDLSPVAEDLLLCVNCADAMNDLKANKKDREDFEGMYLSSKDIERFDSELAKFSRGRLAAWIRANGLPSKYEFSDQANRKEPVTQAVDVSTTERNSMLSIIIGLAVGGYKYDPAASKNRAVTDIISDMDAMGIKMTDDTLRKYLKAAKQFLPNSTQKPNSG